jgi:hypothetical protein
VLPPKEEEKIKNAMIITTIILKTIGFVRKLFT